MVYQSGEVFERVVLGPHLNRGYKTYRSFSESIGEKIKNTGGKNSYPDTRISRLLYSVVLNRLKKEGINPAGLVFLSSIGSRADIHHSTDCLFYLPSLGQVVTVDLFNYSESNKLKDICFPPDGEEYSEELFQNNLFLQKNGMAALLKKYHSQNELSLIFYPFDLRFYLNDYRRAVTVRPENHFLLTPDYTETWQGRKKFAKLVVGYFAKVKNQQDFLFGT